jgi:hypothetical protein
MKCEHMMSTPDPKVDVPCDRPAVAAWRHAEYGTVILCRIHDAKGIRANVAGWVRMAELPFPVSA